MSRPAHVIRLKVRRGPSADRKMRETAALHADVRATVAGLLDRHQARRIDVAYALVAQGIDIAVAATGALSEACRLQALSRRLAPETPLSSPRDAAERLFLDCEEEAA